MSLISLIIIHGDFDPYEKPHLSVYGSIKATLCSPIPARLHLQPVCCPVGPTVENKDKLVWVQTPLSVNFHQELTHKSAGAQISGPNSKVVQIKKMTHFLWAIFHFVTHVVVCMSQEA